MNLYLLLTTVLLLLTNRVHAQTSADVTVDDSHSYTSNSRSGIQYFPSEASWSRTAPSDVSQRFNSTLHISNASYTRVMFFFQGREIHYYGDKGPGYGAVMVNIDGERGAYEPVNLSSITTQYQQLLWSRTGLSEGDHQIIITKNDSVAGLVSMDYFRIVQSNNTIIPSLSGPGASVVPDQALIVDNTDSSVSYSGAWELIQRPGGAISLPSASFYQNTVHRTTSPGAVATFSFDGSAVWYFSDIDTTHSYMDISVDGGTPDSVSGYHNPILSQRLIWSKTGLSVGRHNVTITHRGTPAQYVTLDFFRYLPSNATASIPSGTNDPTQPPTGESKPRKVQVGAIVGVTIGGIVLLGAITYGAFLVYRRRTRWASYVPKTLHWDMRPAPEMANRVEPYEAIPFIVAHEDRASTPVQTMGGYYNSNSFTPSRSYPTTSGSVSELSSYASGTSSRNFSRYSQYELPPSYQQR